MAVIEKHEAPQTSRTAPLVKVLLVDDSLDNLLALEAILEHPSRTLVKATSGEEALKRLLQDDFAVILLDVKMGVMDGYETATLIRQREKTRDIPIIFLTGHNRGEAQVLKGYARGAVDYIIKPAIPEILKSKVEVFIELSKRTAALTHKNMELEAAQKALQEKSQELAERVADLARSNAELERFAYVASHDLTEPLRKVKRYVQLLAQRYEAKLDTEANQFLGFAVEGALRLERLVHDLVTYSQVGVRRMPRTVVDCEAIFQRVLADLIVPLHDSHAVVTHDPLPKVHGVESQVAKVFPHLLDNAIKFRDPKTSPKIHVSAQSMEDKWVFSVQDNGIGIEPQYMERIFMLFERLETEPGCPGNGIGLPICRKIIENHAGRIWVTSQPGKGSTFYFTLPA